VYQVLLWITSSNEAAEHNIDSSRICVGGTSAGGTLAVGVTLKYLHEHPSTPSPIKLIALEDASYTDSSSSYSTSHNPINKIWNANLTRWMWELYVPQGVDALEGGETEKGWVVPLRATDEQLRGLPSTIILAAQWDDLTNDAIKFALRLLEVGVPTEIHVTVFCFTMSFADMLTCYQTYRGTFHISDKLVHDAKCSEKKRTDVIEAIKTAFRV
jgi:acetyl esterase